MREWIAIACRVIHLIYYTEVKEMVDCCLDVLQYSDLLYTYAFCTDSYFSWVLAQLLNDGSDCTSDSCNDANAILQDTTFLFHFLIGANIFCLNH
jgi:hypothetical protein